MKHKAANHPGWKRILQSRFYCSYLDTPQFTGHITLFCMDAVRAPLFVENFNRKICIVDAGYSWLTQFPAGEHYTVTAHYDASARLMMWYIDICLRTGVDQDQIPWTDDLYLDVVISPALDVEVKDAGELLASRERGEISAAEFDLAWRVAGRLNDQIARNQLNLLALSEAHRRMLLEIE